MDFESLLDILERAYSLEIDLMNKYNTDGIEMFSLNQMLYRKIFITFLHDQKNDSEEAKRRLDAASKWLASDPNLKDFEEQTF